MPSHLPFSGLHSRIITAKVHRMRQGLEEILWEGQAACSAPSLLPTTLSRCFHPMFFPPWLTPLPASHPCSLLAVWLMLSSVLLQIQANTRKQQPA